MPAFCAAKPSRRHSASDKKSATQQHVDRWAARCATVEGELLDLRAEKEKSDEGNGRLMAIMTADKKKLQQELAGSEAALEAALHDRAYLEGLVNQQLDEVEKKRATHGDPVAQLQLDEGGEAVQILPKAPADLEKRKGNDDEAAVAIQILPTAPTDLGKREGNDDKEAVAAGGLSAAQARVDTLRVQLEQATAELGQVAVANSAWETLIYWHADGSAREVLSLRPCTVLSP